MTFLVVRLGRPYQPAAVTIPGTLCWCKDAAKPILSVLIYVGKELSAWAIVGLQLDVLLF